MHFIKIIYAYIDRRKNIGEKYIQKIIKSSSDEKSEREEPENEDSDLTFRSDVDINDGTLNEKSFQMNEDDNHKKEEDNKNNQQKVKEINQGFKSPQKDQKDSDHKKDHEKA